MGQGTTVAAGCWLLAAWFGALVDRPSAIQDIMHGDVTLGLHAIDVARCAPGIAASEDAGGRCLLGLGGPVLPAWCSVDWSVQSSPAQSSRAIPPRSSLGPLVKLDKSAEEQAAHWPRAYLPDNARPCHASS